MHIIKYNANTYLAGMHDIGEGQEPFYTDDRDSAMKFETKQIAIDFKKEHELIGHIIPY